MAATSFDLVINAAYKGKGAFKQAQTDVQNLEKDAQKGASAFKLSTSAIAAGVGVATAAIGAAALATKAAWSELNRGAALIQTRTQFENLAASIGATADVMLGKMREATAGMMSDAQLIASASDIISLGLADTEDQAVRLASVVGQLGWDMNQVILTFANNSTMRLDALGLSVESVTKRAKELEAAGMSMDKAFDMAVIEAGEAKIGLLGSSANTTAGKIKVLEAALENAKDAFSAAFAEDLVGEISGLADGAGALGVNLEYAAIGAAHLAAELAKVPLRFAEDTGIQTRINALRDQYVALGGDIEWVNRKIGQLPVDTTFHDIGLKTIDIFTEGIKALESELAHASPEAAKWRDMMFGAAAQDYVAKSAAGLGKWTDEAKKAALETAKLADFNLSGNWVGATASGIMAVASASIDKTIKETQAAIDQLRSDRIDELAAAFQNMAQSASSAFDTAIKAIGEGSDVTFSPEGAANIDLIRTSVYDMGVASGATAGQLADLGVALGQFGPEAAEAAVKAAIFGEAMKLLVADWKLGKINTGDLMASMNEVVTILQNTPPAEIPYVLKRREEDRQDITIPGKVEIDMSSGDPIITHGQSITIPAKPDIAGDALLASWEGALAGIPESSRTIELLGHFAGAEDAGIQAVAQAIDGLDKTIPFIAQMDAVNAALSDLSGKRVSVYVDFIPGGSPTPPGRAAGGPVSSGRPYIVGERGPELFVPRSSGAIIPNSRMSGGGMNVNMTVNFSGPVTDPTKVKDAISDGLAEFFQQVNAAGVSY